MPRPFTFETKKRLTHRRLGALPAVPPDWDPLEGLFVAPDLAEQIETTIEREAASRLERGRNRIRQGGK